MKMVDLKNHRRFTLRCLSQGLVPVSVKLKTTLKTPKGTYIVRKAEEMLMNERVRAINNDMVAMGKAAQKTKITEKKWLNILKRNISNNHNENNV